MYACLLYMLHDAADDHIAILVAKGIHVQFVRTIQILVDQHWSVRVYFHGIINVSLEILVTAKAFCIYTLESRSQRCTPKALLISFIELYTVPAWFGYMR